jgi:methionyl-tRNA formyltransferase
VVVLGGKALALRCLDSMLRMPEVDVVAVVPCADDNPAEERWYPSLAQHAGERGLRVLQPRSVNDAAFRPVLQQLQPDVLLSVFYDKILKHPVLELPSIAAVNIHFGLLPFNRGSFPIPWAMIDGNDPGVTMHHMDPGVDTGDIIAQVAVPAAEHETARDVYDRCTSAGLYLFERYFPLLLQGAARRRRQRRDAGTYYPPGYPFDRWLDWSQPVDAIGRFVRALTFPPFPSARTSFRGHDLEVCHPVWPCVEEVRRLAGTVLEIADHGVMIAARDGAVCVQRMRLHGVELPAAEALWRAGCQRGARLESGEWIRPKAA